LSKPFPYRRLVVVGSTGSGKSTLAEELATKLNLTFIELDALYWETGWREAPVDVFRARAEAATQTPAWVVAGNYHIVRHIVWPRAEAIIWLDYSLPVTFWQLFTRTLYRALTREVLWNGNRETFWAHLKLWSDESLFHWLFKTYWRRKCEFPRLFAQPEFAHLRIFRFTSPGETKAWLCTL
jgi:adenylate kinase family enzyme